MKEQTPDEHPQPSPTIRIATMNRPHRRPRRKHRILHLESLETRRLLAGLGSVEAPLPVAGQVVYDSIGVKGWLGGGLVPASPRFTGESYNRYDGDGLSFAQKQVTGKFYHDPIGGTHATSAFTRNACATFLFQEYCHPVQFGSTTFQTERQRLIDQGNEITATHSIGVPVTKTVQFNITLFGGTIHTLEASVTAVEQRSRFLNHDDVQGVFIPGTTLWKGRGFSDGMQTGTIRSLLGVDAEHNAKVSRPLPRETLRGSIKFGDHHVYIENREEVFKPVNEYAGIGLNTPLYTTQRLLDIDQRQFATAATYTSSSNPFESVVVDRAGLTVAYEQDGVSKVVALESGKPHFFTSDGFNSGLNQRTVPSFTVRGFRVGDSTDAKVGFSVSDSGSTRVAIEPNSMRSIQLMEVNDEPVAVPSEGTTVHGDNQANTFRVELIDGTLTGIARFEAGAGFDRVDVVTDNVTVWLEDYVDVERLSVQANTTIHVSDEGLVDGAEFIVDVQDTDNLRLSSNRWRLTAARLVDGEHYATLGNGAHTLHVPHSAKWHNFLNGYDVNRDGKVSPVDVLTIVNFLNNRGASNDMPHFEPGTLPLLVDVNDDGLASPVDVLAIVNHVNSLDGEGEASTEAADFAFSDLWIGPSATTASGRETRFANDRKGEFVGVTPVRDEVFYGEDPRISLLLARRYQRNVDALFNDLTS